MLLTYVLLAFSTSIDSIGIGATYGLRNIQITKKAKFILFTISFTISMLAVFIGHGIEKFLPNHLSNMIGSGILCFMGLGMLFQAIKDPETYDVDSSKQIDSKEAISLGIALSLDAFSVGIGTGMFESTFLLFPLLVSFFQIGFLSLGRKIALKIQKFKNIPHSLWNYIAASLLIIIGIARFFL